MILRVSSHTDPTGALVGLIGKAISATADIPNIGETIRELSNEYHCVRLRIAPLRYSKNHYEIFIFPDSPRWPTPIFVSVMFNNNNLNVHAFKEGRLFEPNQVWPSGKSVISLKKTLDALYPSLSAISSFEFFIQSSGIYFSKEENDRHSLCRIDGWSASSLL